MTKTTTLEAAIKTAMPLHRPRDSACIPDERPGETRTKLAAVVGEERVLFGSGSLAPSWTGRENACRPRARDIQMNFGPMKQSELNERAGKYP